jgi:hypothetical protein
VTYFTLAEMVMTPLYAEPCGLLAVGGHEAGRDVDARLDVDGSCCIAPGELASMNDTSPMASFSAALSSPRRELLGRLRRIRHGLEPGADGHVQHLPGVPEADELTREERVDGPDQPFAGLLQVSVKAAEWHLHQCYRQLEIQGALPASDGNRTDRRLGRAGPLKVQPRGCCLGAVPNTWSQNGALTP